MQKFADFSPCRTWRYSLHRIWDHDALPLVVIGLNPSTADETADDPTVRRCQGFARSWGMGGLVMLNIFAYRATDPKVMKLAWDPIGPENNSALIELTKDRMVLCAWGNHGAYRDRGAEVVRLLRDRHIVHLGLTAGGFPRHPLYLRADLDPIRFKGVG